MDESQYEQQLSRFVRASITDRPEFKHYFRHPCLVDDTGSTSFDTHYVYHVAWAISKIISNPPAVHHDISSSLHFCTAVCSVTPTTFIDYRPASLRLPNLVCTSGDLTDDSQWQNDQFASLSCLHVVEHIGLGRYGDKLDANGDLISMNNLRRSVRSGGRFLFAVPVGKPAVYFNAHRVYSATWIRDFFASRMRLVEFYFIPGPSELVPLRNCDLSVADRFDYGCGCFEFVCDGDGIR